jgi:cell division septation protein DedD
MRYIAYLLLVANVLYAGCNLPLDKFVVQRQPLFPPMPADVHSLVMLKERAVNTATQTNREEGVVTDKKESATADMGEGPDTERGNAAFIAHAELPDSHQAHICKALGPFDKFSAAETVSDRLVRMGLIPMLRSVDSQIVDDYWVYLPGKGRQYSLEVIQKLTEKKINDYYVYDSKNFLISLGKYKRVDLAERQRAMLQQMGIDALIEERYKSRVEHWLEIYAEGKYDKRLENIAMETPGLQIKTESCMSLASR